MAKMDNDELLELLQRKEQSASHYIHGALGADRDAAMRAYHRQPYGNEEEGWSSVITSDVQDTVEWILPALLKVFTSTDKAVSFEPTTPQDVKGAEQATDACNYVFYKQNNGFLILYTAIKDALLVRNCATMWRKETKEVVSSIPFKGATAEMLAMILQENDEITEQQEAPIIDPQTGQPAVDPMTGQPVMGFNGRIKRVEEKTIVKVEAFNPAYLLVDREWTSPLLADCPYTARLMKVTLSDLVQMGFKNVTAEELRASDIGVQDIYDIANKGTDDLEESIPEDESLAEGYLRIEYVLADIDGDGIAELNCIYRLQEKILKQEVVSHVPFATFSPVLNTHQWDGMSMDDLVGDLQKLHTEMLRQTLNSFYLANNPRNTILTDSNGSPYVNIDDFLNMRPGAAVRQTREGAIQPLLTPTNIGNALPMLDYVQNMREERTGVSKTSQGLNPDSLNNTATGRQLDMTSAMQRIELIARIIAEVYLKPTFLGILKMLTDGGMEKLAFKLRDEFVEYDPNEWRDQYDMTVNVGLGTGDSAQKIQALQMIAQNQINLLPMGLATPQNIYHTQSKLVEAAGFKDVQNFIQDPRGKPPPAPPPNPMIQVEQIKQQGIAQKAQFDAQNEAKKMQLEAQVQDAQHQREMQRDMEVERNKQEMQARDSQFQATLEAQKESQRLQIEEASKQADRELERWKAELDARVKIRIANIGKEVSGDELLGAVEDDLAMGKPNPLDQLATMHAQTLQMVAAMADAINKPKSIVRDQMGRAIGVQPLTSNTQ